jgi:hypothetical protein
MINSQQQVPGVITVDAPAATTNGDNYVLAWTTSDQSILWTTCPASNSQNSYTWAKAASIPNAASSGGPALVSFAGKVWMAWKGEGTDTRIFISSLSGSTWSAGVPISGVGTSSAPALTVTASELYVAWKGEHDNTILWSKSSDGKTWSPQAVVPGAGSSDTPALAGFKGVVYLAWKGESDTKIFLSQFTDAKGWGTAAALPSDFETSSGPALGFGNSGNLHLVWKGASDNFVWESVLASGKTAWSGQAKIVAIETSARPALASQTSSATDILLVWKGGATTNLFAAPLDNLQKLYPLPPGAMPLPTASSIFWTAPAGLTPPAGTSGASDNIGFGSWAAQAAVAMSLVLSSDGTVTFSGWYQDQGNLPVIPAPAQNYHAAVGVLASNGKLFTFSNSKNDVATGGTVDTWNITQKSSIVAQNWAFLEPKPGQSAPQAVVYGSCSNSTDLGSLLDGIIADIESLVGDIEDVVEVVSVIAALAA